jgi:hypothetical protein
MKKKLLVLTDNAAEDKLLVSLTFHEAPATLLTEFTMKVARAYYSGNIKNAVNDLLQRAIAEPDYVLLIKGAKSGNNG